MARETVILRTSDISGATIEDGQGALLRVRLNDGSVFELDALRSEVEELLANARPAKKRGRKASADTQTK
jgi:hypothetical protein